MPPVDVKMLESLADRVVVGQGYDLIDLEWRRETGGWVLRVFIDHPDSADPGDLAKLDDASHAATISHEDCALVSTTLGAELDAADIIHVPYALEVSSPGIERPLKRESDFRRFAGRKARIRTRYSPAEGAVPRRNFSGTLLGVDGGKVRIDVDGQVFEIAVGDVEKAHLEFET